MAEPPSDAATDDQPVDRAQIGARMRANAAGFRAALQRGEVRSRRPPATTDDPTPWSAMERATQAADVYEAADERLNRMLKKKNPTFAGWNRDRAAVEGRYAADDVDRLAYRLASAAGKVADLVDKVRADRWDRPGARIDGVAFTVESYAVDVLAEVTDQLDRVDAGYRAIADQVREDAKRAASGSDG